MTDAEFLDLVRRMRLAQQTYFRVRDVRALAQAKGLEAEVDRALSKRFSEQGELI
jgi:hypothetical protein